MKSMLEESFAEEAEAKERFMSRQHLQKLLPLCRDLTAYDISYYERLAAASAVQVDALSGLVGTGLCFIKAAHHGLLSPACESGCAKSAKRALGYKFCPHCGSKL